MILAHDGGYVEHPDLEAVYLRILVPRDVSHLCANITRESRTLELINTWSNPAGLHSDKDVAHTAKG